MKISFSMRVDSKLSQSVLIEKIREALAEQVPGIVLSSLEVTRRRERRGTRIRRAASSQQSNTVTNFRVWDGEVDFSGLESDRSSGRQPMTLACQALKSLGARIEHFSGYLPRGRLDEMRPTLQEGPMQLGSSSRILMRLAQKPVNRNDCHVLASGSNIDSLPSAAPLSACTYSDETKDSSHSVPKLASRASSFRQMESILEEDEVKHSADTRLGI